MITLETLRHINALVARLDRLRKALATLTEPQWALLRSLENELGTLGVDAGTSKALPAPT